MPVYEYLVAVTPPGGRKKLYYRGTLYTNAKTDEEALEQAIAKVQRSHGFNLSQDYSCVVYQMDAEEV